MPTLLRTLTLGAIVMILSACASSRHYIPREDTAAASSMALSTRYEVKVIDSQSSADAMRLLSPIYMAAGVGMVVANPAVLLVTLPVAGLKP